MRVDSVALAVAVVVAEIEHRAGHASFEQRVWPLGDPGDRDDALLQPVEVDREIVAILDRMIAKEREDRFQSSHELVDALETYLSDRGIRTMTRGLSALAATGALGATGSTSEKPTERVSFSGCESRVPPASLEARCRR